MSAHDIGALVLLVGMVTWGIAGFLTDLIEGLPGDDE